MHLGMSGSFRVERDGSASDARRLLSRPLQGPGPRPRGVPHVVGRDGPLQRSAPVRLDEARAARQARRGAAAARARSRAARQRIRRRHAGARPARARTPASRPRCSTRRVVAGLGNIYVCEAFNRALLSPKRKASTIADRRGAPNERAERLVDAIKAVLNEAIAAGGSSLRDHRRTDGELGDVPAQFPRLRPRGQAVPDARLQGHHQAHRAERALDVFLPGVSEVRRCWRHTPPSSPGVAVKDVRSRPGDPASSRSDGCPGQARA